MQKINHTLAIQYLWLHHNRNQYFVLYYRHFRYLLVSFMFIITSKVMVKVWSVSCLVVSDSLPPIDCSPPGSSVYGILQARILEWVAIPLSRGFSWPKDWTSSILQEESLLSEPPGKPILTIIYTIRFLSFDVAIKKQIYYSTML